MFRVYDIQATIDLFEWEEDDILFIFSIDIVTIVGSIDI